MRALQMVPGIDPRQDILDKVSAYVEEIEVFGAQILVGQFIRPNKTAGGIYLADKTVDEDKYQGKVGLVLKMGPLAFKEDETHDFGGLKVKVGDWVLYRIGDTFPLLIGDHDCRFVEDVAIKAVIARPDSVM